MSQNVRIYAGDTVASGDVVLALKQNGLAVDVSTSTVRWKTRHRASGAVASSVMVVQGAGSLGLVSPVYTSEQSAALGLGEYDVQIEVTSVSGEVRTFPGPDQPSLAMVVVRGL